MISVEKLKGRDHLEEMGIDGNKMLQRILTLKSLN